MQSTDVAIIGAGPIGIELAVALKRAGIDYLHFDAKQIGYTISWFPPQTRFFSSNDRIAIASVPLYTPTQAKATREEYLAYLRAVVDLFELKINNYEPIRNIRRDEDGFTLTSHPRGGAERQYRCKRLVLCTGGTDRARKLGIPGEDLPHVCSQFEDPHKYFRTDVLIVGGKNSAVEAALRCSHAGARVSISYRRNELPAQSIKYWLMPEFKHLVNTGKVKAYFETSPIRITSSHVTLKRGGDTIDVPADFVLLQIGYEQDNTLFKIAGIEISGSCGAPVYDVNTMQSSVRNLYVAGTAVGGTQDKYGVFIENCHVHIERILAALTGAAPPTAPRANEQLES